MFSFYRVRRGFLDRAVFLDGRTFVISRSFFSVTVRRFLKCFVGF